MPPPTRQNYLVVPAIRVYRFSRGLGSGEAFTNVGKNYKNYYTGVRVETYFFGEPSANTVCLGRLVERDDGRILDALPDGSLMRRVSTVQATLPMTEPCAASPHFNAWTAVIAKNLLLVPKLRLGNPVREAPASRLHHQTRITSIKPSCPA